MKSLEFLMEMRKLKNIKRFQNSFRLMTTTIADHEWNVARIAYWIAKMDETFYGINDIDFGYLLAKAVHHDSPKFYAGDIQANLGNEELLKYVKSSIYPEVYESFIKPMVPVNLQSEYRRLMLDGGKATYEDSVVYIANKLDKMFEATEEIIFGNKEYFTEVKTSQQKSLLAYIEGAGENNLPFAKLITSHFLTNKSQKIDADDFKSVACFIEYIKWGRKLIHTKRYQNLTKIVPVNVSAHEWSVARLSFFIATCLTKEEGLSIDMGKLLFTALEHDAIESSTGDFLSHTKRMTEEMERLVLCSEKQAFEIVANKYIPVEWRTVFEEALLNPKSDTIEGDIIRIADAFDVIFECIDEVLMGHRGQFEGIALNKIEYLSKFKYGVIERLLSEISSYF